MIRRLVVAFHLAFGVEICLCERDDHLRLFLHARGLAETDYKYCPACVEEQLTTDDEDTDSVDADHHFVVAANEPALVSE